MRALQQTAPHVFSQFVKELFTVHKSPRQFSATAIDQAHEQNNGMVKGEGGAVGLTENPGTLCREMITGPEMARLVNEFGVLKKLAALPSHQQEVFKCHS